MEADNSDPATPGRLIAAATESFGRLDGALISVGGPPTGTVSSTPDEDWEKAFGSVFLGAVRIAREVCARSSRGGRWRSCSRRRCGHRIPGLAISNGLRPGLAMVAKTLADEQGPRGIRVNGLLPGRVGTERVAELDASTGDAEASKARRSRRSRWAATASRRSSAGPRRSCCRPPRRSCPA